MQHSSSDIVNLDEIFGLTQIHLCELDGSGKLIHKDSYKAFQQMQAQAKVVGIDMQVASAYRSFDRQLSIWNAKASGQRDCLDDSGHCIDLTRLNSLQIIESIMRVSALPGASRHHWGTDLDVYDAAAMPEDYQLQLIAAEYSANGPFDRLNLWLEKHAADFGFGRPYSADRGGIAPEAWHISHLPIANIYSQAFDFQQYMALLEQSDIALKESIVKNLKYLFERYIQIT